MKEFVGETFHKVELEGETVSGALFEDCLFTQCRVKGAVLERCRFSGCQFTDCLLSAPKLKNVTMLSCGFSGCGISGVDWSALVDERKRDMGFLPFDSLERCSLRHCLFYGLDLKGFDFSGADLTGSTFDSCVLEGADFSRCRLGETSFLQNDLRQADFRQAVGYSFSLEGNRVRGAKFSLPEAVGLLSALGLELEGL